LSQQFTVPPEFVGKTLAAALRKLAGNLSWSDARRLIHKRFVRVNSTYCLDDTRRLKINDRIELLPHSTRAPQKHDVPIVHRDEHLVIVEKPPGLQTLRRTEEQHWDLKRKSMQPALIELLPPLLSPRSGEPKGPPSALPAQTPRLFPVHRLDRDTSGLMLFALTHPAQQRLIHMFSKHQVHRTYLAVVNGLLTEPRTIQSTLTRNRGDGLRGSYTTGQLAITHVKPLKPIAARYTLIECQLETGRTHQIRIHLAEIGHMLCGEKLYTRPCPGEPLVHDTSNAPRHALHSTNLKFTHPMTNEELHFTSPLPPDLTTWLAKLEGKQ
jgi:23S rRNA pseudouridine1911/1915/1917 synthase